MIEIEHHPDIGYVIRFPYRLVEDYSLNEHLKETVPGIAWGRPPGHPRKVWHTAASPLQVERIRDFVARCQSMDLAVSITDQAEAKAREVTEAYQQFLQRVESGEEEWPSGDDDVKCGPDGLQLKAWQRLAVERTKDFARDPQTRGSVLSAELGLGKTPMAIRAVIEEDAFPVVCIVPATLKENWRREWLKWTHLDDSDIVVHNGMDPSKNPPLSEAKVHIINYRILGPRVDEWQGEVTSFVFDEAHALRNGAPMDGPKTLIDRASQQAMNALALVQDCNNVILLTGTPIINDPLEMVHPLRVLNADSLFGGYLGIEDEFSPKTERSRRDGSTYPEHHPQNLIEWNRQLEHQVMTRIEREDVYDDLPELIQRAVPVTIDNQADYDRAEEEFEEWYQEEMRRRSRRLVEELEEEHGPNWQQAILDDPDVPDPFNGMEPMAWVRAKVSSAMEAEALVKIGALKRVVGIGKARPTSSIVREAVEEGEQVLVFCHHKSGDHNVAGALCEALSSRGVSVDAITGDVPEKDRMDIVDRFQGGELDVLVGTFGAASEGLTLTAAWTVVFAELDWTPAKMAQAVGRCYARMNDPHGVNVIYAVAQDTVDEHIWERLAQKREVFAQLVQGKPTDDTHIEWMSENIPTSQLISVTDS